VSAPKPTRQDAQVAKLMGRLRLFEAHNAVLHAQDKNRKLQFANGLSDLLASAQMRGGFAQDAITSMAPAINANQYAVWTLNYNMLMFMYATHGLLQTAIDEPVQDAHRDKVGLTCKDGLTAKNLEELEQWLEENEVDEPFIDAQIWGRTFGGAALILNVAGNPTKPLDYKELERGRFALYPATRWELGGTWRYSDAYNFYGVTFDKSRVKTFIGKRMPWILERQLSGWGASLIARMAEDFNVFLRGRNALYETINEFKIDIYKLKGYNDQLLTGEGTATVDRRVATTNALKNFHKALILDAEDDYIVRQPTFAGLADVMRENRLGLVAATRMPISKLFGERMGGLGDGDGDDLENYHSLVTSEVRKPARALKRWIIQLGCVALFGDGYHVDFEYPSLRVQSAKEEEELKTSKQNRILGQLDAGLIDEYEAAAWAAHERLMPIKTKLAQQAGEQMGHPTEDVPRKRGAQGGDREQGNGAQHQRTSSGLGGDGRQVPKFG
jgi:phage-related protein (TIGR01555 family)